MVHILLCLLFCLFKSTTGSVISDGISIPEGVQLFGLSTASSHDKGSVEFDFVQFSSNSSQWDSNFTTVVNYELLYSQNWEVFVDENGTEVIFQNGTLSRDAFEDSYLLTEDEVENGQIQLNNLQEGSNYTFALLASVDTLSDDMVEVVSIETISVTICSKEEILRPDVTVVRINEIAVDGAVFLEISDFEFLEFEFEPISAATHGSSQMENLLTTGTVVIANSVAAKVTTSAPATCTDVSASLVQCVVTFREALPSDIWAQLELRTSSSQFSQDPDAVTQSITNGGLLSRRRLSRELAEKPISIQFNDNGLVLKALVEGSSANDNTGAFDPAASYKFEARIEAKTVKNVDVDVSFSGSLLDLNFDVDLTIEVSYGLRVTVATEATFTAGIKGYKKKIDLIKSIKKKTKKALDWIYPIPYVPFMLVRAQPTWLLDLSLSAGFEASLKYKKKFFAGATVKVDGSGMQMSKFEDPEGDLNDAKSKDVLDPNTQLDFSLLLKVEGKASVPIGVQVDVMTFAHLLLTVASEKLREEGRKTPGGKDVPEIGPPLRLQLVGEPYVTFLATMNLLEDRTCYFLPSFDEFALMSGLDVSFKAAAWLNPTSEDPIAEKTFSNELIKNTLLTLPSIIQPIASLVGCDECDRRYFLVNNRFEPGVNFFFPEATGYKEPYQVTIGDNLSDKVVGEFADTITANEAASYAEYLPGFLEEGDKFSRITVEDHFMQKESLDDKEYCVAGGFEAFPFGIKRVTLSKHSHPSCCHDTNCPSCQRCCNEIIRPFDPTVPKRCGQFCGGLVVVGGPGAQSENHGDTVELKSNFGSTGNGNNIRFLINGNPVPIDQTGMVVQTLSPKAYGSKSINGVFLDLEADQLDSPVTVTVQNRCCNPAKTVKEDWCCVDEADCPTCIVTCPPCCPCCDPDACECTCGWETDVRVESGAIQMVGFSIDREVFNPTSPWLSNEEEFSFTMSPRLTAPCGSPPDPEECGSTAAPTSPTPFPTEPPTTPEPTIPDPITDPPTDPITDPPTDPPTDPATDPPSGGGGNSTDVPTASPTSNARRLSSTGSSGTIGLLAVQGDQVESQDNVRKALASILAKRATDDRKHVQDRIEAIRQQVGLTDTQEPVTIQVDTQLNSRKPIYLSPGV